MILLAEPDKRYAGDGNDNPANAAQKTGEAAKQVGSAAGEKTAAAGAESATNAAAAAVQAGAEGGKAVSEVAAGAAAGGPWGAIIAAAWAARHTLLKILVCLCLFLAFIISAVIMLPSIVFNNIFQTDPGAVEAGGLTDPWAIYDALGILVGERVEEGHDYALKEAERIIEEGGYDYELSMEALVDHGFSTGDYDTCYVLAAYSAAMEQRGTTKADLSAKLRAVREDMFPISCEGKELERAVQPSGPADSSAPASDESSTDTSEESGNTTEPGPDPDTEVVKYLEITIHPFDTGVILKAFHIDAAAPYGQFNITTGEVIGYMAEALRMTLGLGPGLIPPGASDIVGSGEYIWPVPASRRVTSYYGERIHPITGERDFHLGIDIGAAEGTPVVAADSGTVVSVSIHHSYGIHCLIDHGNGSRTLYAHLSSMNVSVGSAVVQGQEIGRVGHTGTADGDHLHFETHAGAGRVDPKTYFPGI